jgi:hypothetical protein
VLLLKYSWNLKFFFKGTWKALEKRKVFKNSLIKYITDKKIPKYIAGKYQYLLQENIKMAVEIT